MTPLPAFAFKAALSALHYSGLARALAPATRGSGAVFMLHHVCPEKPREFAPNRLLQITPAFLDEVVGEVRRQGFDIVALDEVPHRLSGAVKSTRPFASFTSDDGYRDNRDYALPILRKHGVPLAIYAAADFADGKGFLWWLVLERIIARRNYIALRLDGSQFATRCTSDREKTDTFSRIYWLLRRLPERRARAIVADLARETGIDVLAPCRELVMNWSELREIASDPLVTIGAHTRSHLALAQLDARASHDEIAGSVERIELELGVKCRHFCYPYGDAGSAGQREFDTVTRLGLATGVTTRKGLLGAGNAASLSALPRVSLNGNFQKVRYLKSLLSGVPFALWRAIEQRRTPAPAYSPVGASGFCIQRTSQAAGSTQANPPTI